ncbi:MAG: hypothetical protein ACW98J_11090 [Candidatus Thorarchaeota archaeon]
MKHRGILILLMWLITLQLLPTNTTAVTDHGLRWGYETSSEAYFPGRVLVLPRNPADYELPNNVSTWWDIPRVGLEAMHDTGESINLISELFEYLPQAGNRFILPIGNWPLLGDLIKDAYDNVTVFEGLGTWGFSLNHSIEPSRTAVLTITYETGAGWLYDYNAALYYSENDSVETIRAGRLRNPVQQFFEFVNPVLTPILIVVIIIGICLGRLGRPRFSYRSR